MLAGGGKTQTLLSNTSQIYFGVNDNVTAKEVSERLGEWTQVVENGGVSRGSSNTRSYRDESLSSSINIAANWLLAAQKVAKPEEIIAMDPREAITVIPGMRPIKTWLLRYYEEPYIDEERELRKTMRAAVASMIVMIGFSGMTGVALLGMSHGRTRSETSRHVFQRPNERR